MSLRRVALIGSFREPNYARVQKTLGIFAAGGLTVLSPSGAAIVSGVEFVRFASDPTAATDAEIQTETLQKIFAADAVYVVTGPSGYVGKTTCYEVGRIIQRRQPLYFSESPDDLPIHVPSSHVVSPDGFVLRFVIGNESACGLFEQGNGGLFDAERSLSGLPERTEGGTFVPA